jgi:hypothetical protein
MYVYNVSHTIVDHVDALLLHIGGGGAGKSSQFDVAPKICVTSWQRVNNVTSGVGETFGTCCTHSVFYLNRYAFFTDHSIDINVVFSLNYWRLCFCSWFHSAPCERCSKTWGERSIHFVVGGPKDKWPIGRNGVQTALMLGKKLCRCWLPSSVAACRPVTGCCGYCNGVLGTC